MNRPYDRVKTSEHVQFVASCDYLYKVVQPLVAGVDGPLVRMIQRSIVNRTRISAVTAYYADVGCCITKPSDIDHKVAPNNVLEHLWTSSSEM